MESLHLPDIIDARIFSSIAEISEIFEHQVLV
jgi:hypothetical protein